MNAKFVDQLARLETGDSSELAEAAGAFVQIYTNPAFGWRIAQFFARTRTSFSLTMIGRNHWLFKAYLSHFDPVSYRHSDVETAFEISQQPGQSAKLKAMLMTGLGHPIDAHLSRVAEMGEVESHPQMIRLAPNRQLSFSNTSPPCPDAWRLRVPDFS